MSRGPFTIKRDDHWDVSFWLVLDRFGGVRLTRGEPDLSRDERGMSLQVKVPFSLFSTPVLRATMEIKAPDPIIPPIDLTAAADALKRSLGCDIDVQIVPHAASDARPSASGTTATPSDAGSSRT